MSYSVNVPETEVNEVVQWAESAVLNEATDHEDGTYEQGVYNHDQTTGDQHDDKGANHRKRASEKRRSNNTASGRYLRRA